jgi:outer membrane protein TolC
MKIKIPTLLTCAVITTSSIGYAQLTLNDAIISALSHDPTIEKNCADVHEALGFTDEVRADLRPQLSLDGHVGIANRDRGSVGGDTDLSRRISITGRQHLWDGGFNKYRWEDAKQRLEAQERLLKAQREATAIGTVEAFLDVIRARKQIEFAKQSVDAHEKVFGLAKKRAEAAGNQADIELSESRYSLARTLLLERQLALKQAEAAFVRWVGYKPTSKLIMPRTPDISALSDIDPRQNFHYIAALKQHEAATLEKKAFEKRYGPKFFLEGTAGLGQEVRGTRGQDNDASLLIVGSWEIFDGGRRKGQVAQAAANIERQVAIMNETLVLLNQDISARWEDYRSIRKRLDVLRGYAGSLDKTFNLYQEQFGLGTRPLLSLLDIQNELIAASIRITDTERDRTFLGYRLLFFGGRLITETVGAKYLDVKCGQRPPDVSKNPVKPEVSKSTVSYITDPPEKALKWPANALAESVLKFHTKPYRISLME